MAGKSAESVFAAMIMTTNSTGVLRTESDVINNHKLESSYIGVT